jgi:hypothetical protein
MPRRASKAQSEFLNQMRAFRHQWDKADPSTFGLSTAQIQQFGAEYEQARAAHDRVEDLRTQLAQALAAKRRASNRLRRTFGGLSSIMDGLVRASGDQGVYTRAHLRKPEKKRPLPTPEAPTDLEITPGANGKLELTFKIADKGRGNLMYEVRRRCESLDGVESAWEPVAVTPKRTVVDDDVPTGLRNIGYQVRALRTNGKVGEWSSERKVPSGVFRGVAPGEGVGEGAAQGQVEGKPEGAAIAGKPG